MANTWNESGTTWSQGNWGEQNNFTLTLTTGLSATASVGDLTAYPEQGWGRDDWGQEPWGESFDPTVILTAPANVSASIGSPTVSTEINVGWGQDGWGVENWGSSGLTFELTAPTELTANIGATGWGNGEWGEPQGWGTFVLTPADVVGLTGLSSTSAVGSLSLQIDFTGTLTAPSTLTASVGSLDPTQEIVGLTGLGVTSSVGAITPADVMGLTGVSATTAVGSIETSDAQVFTPTAPSAATSAVGSIIIELGVPLTAPSNLTASVGAITPADVVGLEGQEATTELGTTGFGTIAYKDIDITGNTSYTDVNHAA
jgi:hypothetical protein